MNRWAWIFFGLLMASGITLVIGIGLQPKPVKLVKPSYFEAPESIADVVWERYGDVLRKEKHIIFGIAPGVEFHERIARRFFERAREAGVVVETGYRETRLSTSVWQDVNGWPSFDLRMESDVFLRNLRSESGFYLLPNFYSSHVIGDTPVQKVEKDLGRKVLSFSLIGFVLSMEDLPDLYPACDGRAVLGEKSVSALGCAAKRKSLSVFRNKLNRDRYVMAMEQTGEKDYLMYVWAPRSSVAK